MVRCKQCREKVSKRAKACPHCGEPKPGQRAWETVLGTIIVIVLLVWFTSNGDGPNGNDVQEPGTAADRASQDRVPTASETDTNGARRWVTVDQLNRRTCPSTDCGVVGVLFYREGVEVYEVNGDWARVTASYDASCVAGRSEWVDSGDDRCTPENGIVDNRFAEWVAINYLSTQRPSDPAATATDREALVAESDGFRHYATAFVEAAESLIAAGRCTESDFREFGGWAKSVSHKEAPIYFVYCGGMRSENRIYLHAETGEIRQSRW